MAYSKEQIDQVKQAVDIVDVIDSYVPLKKRGAYFWALSPFKQEKTPSFSVHPQKQFFKCYASGESGDVFDFIVLYENLEFPEAVKRLAERAGIRLQETGAGIDKDEREKIENLLQIHDTVQRYWSDILLHDPRAQMARDYMKHREMPLEWAEIYGLGYAPDGWQDMLEWCKKRGYAEPDLVESGLVVRNERGKVYDRFRGRLLFPIQNDGGRTIAFSGRILDPDAKTAKYVNSPETSIFTKSRVLFAFHQAKRPILDEDCAVICEGQIDVLRCHSVGIKNVTAPLGTSFTPDHARAIRRLTSNVILCLDSDSAGQNATDRTARLFLQPQQGPSLSRQADLSVRVATLPSGHDPDSIIRSSGADAFLDLINSPSELIDFFIELQKSKHPDSSIMAARRSIIEEVSKLIQQLPTLTLREQNISRAAYRLNVSPDLFHAEMNRLKAGRQRMHDDAKVNIEEGSIEDRTPTFSPNPIIHEMLQLLLTRQQLIPDLQRILFPEWIMDKPGGDLLVKMMELYSHDAWDGIDSFIATVSRSHQIYLKNLNLNSLDHLDIDDETCLQQLRGACYRLELEYLSGQLKLNSESRKHLEINSEKENQLLEEQVLLAKKQEELLKKHQEFINSQKTF